MRNYLVDSTHKADVMHFDWISVVFSFDSFDALKNSPFGSKSDLIQFWVSHYLHLDEVWYPSGKLQGYDKSLGTANNSIFLGFNTYLTKSDNFLIQLSGSGVEHLETVLSHENYTIDDFLIKFCKDMPVDEFHFTRLDPCRNFFNWDKHVSALYVGKQIELGNLISKSRYTKTVHSFSSDGALPAKEAYTSSKEGYTTYIGKNPKQLRIYNKLAERRAKLSKFYNLKSWSRWEFQLNGNHAQEFYELYLRFGLPKAWTSYCKDFVRFITKAGQAKQSKKSRYKTAKWFNEIIESAEEIKLRRPGEKPTLQRTNKWLINQVSTRLAEIVKARELKYIANGFEVEDAEKLAREKVISDLIDDKINDENFDISTALAWSKEHWKDII